MEYAMCTDVLNVWVLCKEIQGMYLYVYVVYK